MVPNLEHFVLHTLERIVGTKFGYAAAVSSRVIAVRRQAYVLPLIIVDFCLVVDNAKVYQFFLQDVELRKIAVAFQYYCIHVRSRQNVAQ